MEDVITATGIIPITLTGSHGYSLSSLNVATDLGEGVSISLSASLETAVLDRFFHMSYVRNISKFYIGKKKMVVKPTNGLVYPYITTAATEK